MKKDKFNTKLRDFARTLSPNQEERDLIGKIYQSINNLLWTNNCIQVGSYPRKTSITPVHDLDIMYFLWNRNENAHDPHTVLESLYDKIMSEYKNPTKYAIKVSLQTHSVTISYQENNEEELWVDIVPAYIFGKNEFWDDTYKVPEIVNMKHENRSEIYQKFAQAHKEMWWITSDPRGYISVATNLDWTSKWELRKSIKLIKRRKNNLRDRDIDKNLKLKSFHVEQVITQFFQENDSLEVFDAIFKFFTELPGIIWTPNQIADRANADKFIDDYLENFTQEQKDKIKEARDCLLIKLENIKEDHDIWDLFKICFHKRACDEESFLFDQKITTLTDDNYKFSIYGKVLQWNWRSQSFLDRIWLIYVSRQIEFGISWTIPQVDLFKRKVKNDDKCDQPRWEITDHHTKKTPEETKFQGNHYVECYAILNNICVAKTRQNVTL